MGETVVFLGFVACCFREEEFFSTCPFGEGDIWLLWFVLGRMGETQGAEEGKRGPASDSASPALQSPGFITCSVAQSCGESFSYAPWNALPCLV